MVPLEPGDTVYVFAVLDERRNIGALRGKVWSPSIYKLSPGMRLSDLIDNPGGLKDDTYLSRAQTIHVDPLDLSKGIVPVSLAAGSEDPELRECDEVVVYSVSEFRGSAVRH